MGIIDFIAAIVVIEAIEAIAAIVVIEAIDLFVFVFIAGGDACVLRTAPAHYGQ